MYDGTQYQLLSIDQPQANNDAYVTEDELNAKVDGLFNSETWTFTLADGSTTTKQVMLSNYSTETWTFTLEDGTTVTKKVVLS